MWSLGHRPYSDYMTERSRSSLQRHPYVTIEAAAELTNVGIPTLREWTRRGDLTIEQRGDMEVVQLDEVTALASRHRATSTRGGLRDRLKDTDGRPSTGDVVNVADLQELARRREE